MSGMSRVSANHGLLVAFLLSQIGPNFDKLVSFGWDSYVANLTVPMMEVSLFYATSN